MTNLSWTCLFLNISRATHTTEGCIFIIVYSTQNSAFHTLIATFCSSLWPFLPFLLLVLFYLQEEGKKWLLFLFCRVVSLLFLLP